MQSVRLGLLERAPWPERAWGRSAPTRRVIASDPGLAAIVKSCARLANVGPLPTICWQRRRRRVQNDVMKSRRPAVSPEDEALFLAAVDGARPLDKRDRIPVPPPPPSPVRIAEPPPEVKLEIEGDGQRYMARAPGVSRVQLSELRTGKFHTEDTLDLHGHTVELARQELREFLAGAHRLGQRCVLVVHGKGTHSEHGAPLREAVLTDLLGPLSGFIHAFATAAPSHGGEGATYIMLRSRK